MNRDQAYALVRQTFTQAFDKSRFATFVKNVLNHLDEGKAASWGNVKDAFKAHVQRYERLGTYNAPDGRWADVLVVYLTDDSKLERARTAIRNFVADHLKARDERDAALVAFVSPSEVQWRFSYVKMEYATVKADSGKVGVEARLTPARRFSYIVGAGESCHTAQTRFLGLLQRTATNPSLTDIESAFSVEAVTKEFFAKYTEIFEAINTALTNLLAKNRVLRQDFKQKAVNTVDFAKKLMGQVVFLYFLQKKGWLGVEKGKGWGDGPRDFLRRLASGRYGSYVNLFNDVLEPLFYDTLATDRGHLAWCSQFHCRIPFLNGGLFEPLGNYDWRKTEVLLPNRLFTNSDPVEDGVVGSGLLDVFDRYNFTVNEAEPLEKEVAIDPEMLGKVFENLIEENRRKGLGSFYTPREIVHYMCQQSLINYLDMAVNARETGFAPAKARQSRLFTGSAPEQGSLTAGEYQEIVPRADIETLVQLGEQISHYEAVDTTYRIKMPPSIERNAKLIDQRLSAITVCDPAVGSGAFPVGMMTEIVRARSALTPYFNAVDERTPYHFKRHAIQACLYGVDIDPGAVEIAKLRLWLSLVVDEEEAKQIKPLPNLDFKIVAGDSLLGFPFKSARLREIEELKERFFEETDHERKAELKDDIELALRKCFASSAKSLGYEVNFDFEVYFSEVFQSPRGGFDVVIANPPYVDSETMVRADPRGRERLAQAYETARGNWDLYIPFWELALKRVNRHGTATLITPNKWLSIGYAKRLRELARPFVSQIVDYSRFRAFESVGVFPVVTLMAKASQGDLLVRRYMEGQRLTFEQRLPPHYLADFENWGVFLSSYLPLVLILSARGRKLRTLCDLEEACTVSEAYELTKYIREAKGSGHGSFKFVNTGTIDPYVSLWGHKPTTYIKKKYSKPVIAKAELRRDFPRRYDQSASPKIVIAGIRHFESFLDKHGAFTAGKSTVILRSVKDGTSLEYLLALLNSRTVRFFLRECYGSLAMDGGINFSPANVGEIPVPEPKGKITDAVLGRLEKILAAKRGDPEANTSESEAEIDRLIFSLYGLAPEEIGLLEGTEQPSAEAEG